MRRYLIIIAVVILLIGIGVAVYFLFFAKPAVTTTPGTGLPTAGQNTGGGGSPVLTTPTTPTSVSPRLVRISAGPVVLGEVVTNQKGTASSSAESIVHFIERQSGNVFSYGSSSKTLTRTSNKTVPGIQSASWLPNGSLAFVRYLSGDEFSTINTYALPANGGAGFFLSQNIADLSVSSTSVLTLASAVNGSAVSLVQTDGTRSTQLFTTPLSSIRISFAGKNQYLVYTKPSSQLPGNAYVVDNTGTFSRIAGPLLGLAALPSPSGKWILVSYVNSGGMQMSLVNTSTSEALSLPVNSIVDKCVWSADETAIYCGVPLNPPSAAYPDDWYQGAVHFSDRIWKIQVSGRYAQLILDFEKDAESQLDATALAIDPSSSTLVFVNKNDLSLWSYSL